MKKFVEYVREHIGISGIQKWSAGELFPFRVQVVGYGTKQGIVQGIAPGGKVVSEHPYGPDEDDFNTAQAKVKDDLLKMLDEV